MTRTSHRLTLAGLALLLVATEARAGVSIKVVTGGRKVTLQFEGNKVRVEEEGNSRIIVFDGDAHRYIEIQDAARTFATATSDDVIKAGRAFDAQLKQHLATADPEEVRAWVERRDRMRKRVDAMKRTRFEQTDAQVMMLEYMCDGYDEIVGAETVAWGCYVPWSRKTFRKEEFTAVTRLAEFLNSGFGHVEAAQGMDLRDGPLGRLARGPGLPLFRLELVDGGKSAVPMKVVEITRQTIPPERFRPPPGYVALTEPPSLALPVKAALPPDSQRQRPAVPPSPPPARAGEPAGR